MGVACWACVCFQSYKLCAGDRAELGRGHHLGTLTAAANLRRIACGYRWEGEGKGEVGRWRVHHQLSKNAGAVEELACPGGPESTSPPNHDSEVGHVPCHNSSHHVPVHGATKFSFEHDFIQGT